MHCLCIEGEKKEKPPSEKGKFQWERERERERREERERVKIVCVYERERNSREIKQGYQKIKPLDLRGEKKNSRNFFYCYTIKGIWQHQIPIIEAQVAEAFSWAPRGFNAK